MNNRILIPVLIFPLVVALIVGLFFVFRADDNIEPKDPDATDNGTIVDPEDIQHTTGNPVIEFDEGNEAYLDESIVRCFSQRRKPSSCAYHRVLNESQRRLYHEGWN